MMENSSIHGITNTIRFLRFAECRLASGYARAAPQYAAFDQANAIRRRQMHPVVEECFTHGPVALTKPRACQLYFFRYRYLPLPQSTGRFRGEQRCASPSKHFAAFTHHHLGVGETRRASSTQQSEYSNPRLISGLTLNLRQNANQLIPASWCVSQMIVHKQTNANHPRRAQMRRCGRRKRIGKAICGAIFSSTHVQPAPR